VEPSAAALRKAAARAAAKIACQANILAPSQRGVRAGVATHSPHRAESVAAAESSSTLSAGMVVVGRPWAIARAAFHHDVGDLSSMAVASQAVTTIAATAAAKVSMGTETTGTIKAAAYLATRTAGAARIVDRMRMAADSHHGSDFFQGEIESGKYLFGTFWIPFLDISVCSPWASGVLPLVSLSF